MSTSAHADDRSAEDIVESYLRRELARDSAPLYVKAKHIASDLEGDWDPCHIGGVLGQWRARSTAPVDVEVWGGEQDGRLWVVSEQ